MARLYRFVKLNDRFDTQVFTFILPGSLGQDSAHRDVESKEFLYGHQKWQILLTRGESHIGAFLLLKNATDGLTCHVDFYFTFTNKEHFAKNESYTERKCKFTAEKFKVGRKAFVSTTDLNSRGFLQDNGNYLLDLEMRGMTSVFEQVIQLPSETSKSLQIGSANRHQKIETGYFPFGNFDWSLIVYPFGDVPERDGRPLVYLVRQTGLDHHCRVLYKIILGQGDKALTSNTIEQVVDTSGQGNPYNVSSNLYQLTSSKNKLHIKIELLNATTISECHLFPLNRSKNKSHLYDREKQAWLLESDASLTYLKFRLFYTDARNVPRRHMRHQCWSVSVTPRRGHYKPIQALAVPYSHYYTQMEVDVEGYDIQTDISVKEISNPASAILDRDGRMTVQVEWIDSHFLYDDLYNKLDEVDSKHKYQMAREIMALQSENLSLEKQVYSYQMNLSRNNSKGTLEIPNEIQLLTASPGSTSPKKSLERRSSRRDRSRDRRRRTDTPDKHGDKYQDSAQYGGNTVSYGSNGSDYSYNDKLSDHHSTGKAASEGGLYNGRYDRNTIDGYAETRSEAGYPDVRSRDYRGDYKDEKHGDQYYNADYQYYSDKYSNTATYPPEEGGYSTAEPYYDKTANKHDARYYENTTEYQSDPYTTADQYNNSRYSPPEKYPETTTYSPEKVPEIPVHPAGYTYTGESYTEEFVRKSLDRRPSTRSKMENGTRVRPRDQQSDDGYFSSQSTPYQIDLLTQQPVVLPTPGVGNQFLETYPEERIERLSGRRSPSIRSKQGRKSSASNKESSNYPAAAVASEQVSPISRDRPKSRRHHKEK